MSGLFTSLADRARGETRAVRPRLPARFETSAPDIVEFAVETPATSPAQPAVVAPASATAAWAIDADDDAPPLDAPPATADPAGPQAGTRVAARSTTDSMPAASASSRVGSGALGVSITAQAAVTPPPGTDPPERHLPTPLAPQVRIRSPQGAAPVPNDAPSQPTAAMAAETRPTDPPPRRELAPRLALARNPAPRPPDEPAREETTVHVSIGRIELRAARSEPPPAPKPRAPAAPPVMSLDDYLRSRRARP